MTNSLQEKDKKTVKTVNIDTSYLYGIILNGAAMFFLWAIIAFSEKNLYTMTMLEGGLILNAMLIGRWITKMFHTQNREDKE